MAKRASKKTDPFTVWTQNPGEAAPNPLPGRSRREAIKLIHARQRASGGRALCHAVNNYTGTAFTLVGGRVAPYFASV